MEAVLAFKQTAELDAAKYMTKYIAQQYSESEAAKHREACHEFAEQREALRSALREERVTLEQLQQYYHQLDCVAAHFPVSARETKLTFVWYDSLTPKKKCAQCNIALERSATIFNMATAYAAQAARHRQLMTEDGTKQAAGSYLWAAACFRQLRTAFVPVLGDPITPDLSLSVVSAMEKVMEAEAQELWLTKAEAMGMKKSTLAGLTQGTLSLWQEAQRFITAASLGQILPGKTAHYVDMRVCWLTANAQRYMSDHLNDETQPGEAIARLRITVEELGKARAIAKKQLHKSVEERLALAATEVDAQLQVLEKDNETIYLESIPLTGQLEPIKPLVQIKPAELSLTGSFGGDGGSGDLWESLVSADEYVAVQSFKEQEQAMAPQLVEELGGTMAEHTAKAQEQLKAWELPHMLDSLHTPSGEIPQRLLRKITALHESGGVDGLEAAVRELQVKADNRGKILTSCDDILKREAEEDAKFRAKYGADKWTAKPSDVKTVRLRKEWNATKELCAQEARKLERIASQTKAARPELELVSAPVEELIKQIPSSLGTPKPSVATEAAELSQQLTQLLGELEDLVEARVGVQEAWLEAAASVDIRGALRGSDPAEREALAKAEMQKYDAPSAAARESLAEQGRILQLIGAAHEEFTRLKPPSTEVDRLVQEFFDRCATAVGEAGRLRDEISSLVAQRENSAKHFARLEPECIRYVEKRAVKREALLDSLGVANPRAYRPNAARVGRRGGGRGRSSGGRGGGGGGGAARHSRSQPGGRGRGGGSTRDQRPRRSSVERTIQISGDEKCTWWWRLGSKGGAEQYNPYSDEQSALLEAAFLTFTSGSSSPSGSGSAGSLEGSKVALSADYFVDFASMRQVSTHDERKSRPVQRRPTEEDGAADEDEDDQDGAPVLLPESDPPERKQQQEPEPEAEELPVPLPLPVPSAPPAADVQLPADSSPTLSTFESAAGAGTGAAGGSPQERSASSEAVMMGFDVALVDRVQGEQRAACGAGYEHLQELLPALLATEQDDQTAAATASGAGGGLSPASPLPAPVPAPALGLAAAEEASPRPVPAVAAPAPAAAAAAAAAVVVWEWKADRGWKPYAPAVSALIETAWLSCGGDSGSSSPAAVQGRTVLEGGTHAVDFGKMRQVNVSDEKRSRAVRRQQQHVDQQQQRTPSDGSPPPGYSVLPPADSLAPGRPMTPPTVVGGGGGGGGGGSAAAGGRPRTDSGSSSASFASTAVGGGAPGTWDWKACVTRDYTRHNPARACPLLASMALFLCVPRPARLAPALPARLEQT
jgi:hypothetical protein